MSYFKKFFNSTILGLTLGVLLAGYAVFAFSSPTQAPPGGNTTAPVNVGGDAQVKLGGLSVGSLLVDGGIKTGGLSSLPTCNVSTEGTLVFNTNIKKISVCTGNVWEVFSTGIDFDGDGVIAGVDCNDGNAAVWQYIFPGYPDSDNDGHVAIIAESACSGSSLPSGYSAVAGDDCNDSCPTCYPGSTAYTTSPDSYDQDCDGNVNNVDTLSPSKSCNVDHVSISTANSACPSWCQSQGSSGGSMGLCSTSAESCSYNSFNWGSCSKSSYDGNCAYDVYHNSCTCTCTSFTVYR